MASLLEKARNSMRNSPLMMGNQSSPSNNRDEEQGEYALRTNTTDLSSVAGEEGLNNTNTGSNSNNSGKSGNSGKSNSSKPRHPPIIKRLSSRQIQHRRQHSRQMSRSSTAEDYQLQPDDQDVLSQMSLGDAHYKQNVAPLSSMFCLVQCIILPVMMWQCGIAPMNINPMIGPYPDALNYWGAKNAVLIIEDGEFYRLLTPIFLHAGLIHLAGNVMVQTESGNRWEKEWGSLIWIIVYISSAIGSSILSTCAMPDQISVGSSGAVMGLYGAKLAEILLLCCERSKTFVEHAGAQSRKEQACGVIFGIILVMAMSFIPYVDWAAHLGGMVAGFAVGLVCFSFKIRQWFFMLVWLIVGVGTTFVMFSGALAYMYTSVETKEELRDVCGYYKQYFDDYECQCMLDEAIHWGSWVPNRNGGGDGGGAGEGAGGEEGARLLRALFNLE